MEYKVVSQYEDTPRIAIHETEHPGFEARLAINLIERWGLVAAESDGEDSAGRAKSRLSTPKELAQRACDVAAEASAELRKRGWIFSLPSQSEIDAEFKRNKESKKKERVD
ncbi:MAG: hypothetical protein P4L84_07880 [Isosphaeraceae bacterium]|nr:hypothetical protein [Isosphaeraceae bacterium]